MKSDGIQCTYSCDENTYYDEGSMMCKTNTTDKLYQNLFSIIQTNSSSSGDFYYYNDSSNQ